MGPLCGKRWLLSGTRVQPSSVSSSSTSIANTSGITSCRRTTFGETGDRKGTPTVVPRLLQPSVSCDQERRQLQADHRPFNLEPFHPQGEVQDGDCTVHPCRCPSQGLCGISGPVRCIFPCIDPSHISQVPSFHRWNFGVPVSGTSIRANFSSSGFYPNYVGGRCIPSLTGYSASSVSGRLAPVVCQSPGASSPSRPYSLHGHSSGVDHQHQEVGTDPKSDLYFCGHSVPHCGQPSPCASGQGFGYSNAGAGLSRSHVSDCQVLPLPPRGSECGGRFDFSRSSSSTTSTVCLAGSVETYPRSSLEGHFTVSRVPPALALVESTRGLLRSTIVSTTSNSLPLYGCQSGGVGCSPGAFGPLYVRPMVSCRITGSHQCPGTRSVFSSSQTLSAANQRSVSPAVLGQYVSGFLPASSGRHSLPYTLCQSEGSPTLVSSSERCSLSTAPPRSPQCSSRPPVSVLPSASGGMDSVSVNPSPSLRQIRPAISGSFCDPLEQSTSSLCVPGSRSSSLCSRRHVHGVGVNLRVCVSSVHTAPSGSQEDSLVGCVLHHLDSTSLAEEVVVQRSSGSADRSPHTSSSVSRTPVSASRSVPSPKPGNSTPARLEVVKRGVRKAKFSGAVASLVAKARRQSTSRVYDSKWLAFCRWCRSRKTDPSSPSIQLIADFLVHLFHDLNLSVSTIKGYRAMLSNTLKMVKGAPSPGSDPVISELIRSFELARPVSRSLAPKWNLSVVLKSLIKGPFEPLGDASILHLTWKTVFLLTLATSKRRSEIHAFSVEPHCFRFNADGSVSLTFQPGFLAKNQLPSSLPPPIVVPSLSVSCGRDDPDRLLCPVRALKFYRRATSASRGSRSRLFLPIEGSGDISAATISRWIKATIRFAYAEVSPDDLNEFQVRAHELRALSSSWAFFKHAPLEEVLSAAFWRSATTFSSFYLRSFSSEVDDLHSLGPIVAAQRVVAPSQ